MYIQLQWVLFTSRSFSQLGWIPMLTCLRQKYINLQWSDTLLHLIVV